MIIIGAIITVISVLLGMLIFAASAHHPTGGTKLANSAFIACLCGFGVGLLLMVVGAIWVLFS